MSYHGPTCRDNPKLPASVCDHWWCVWHRMVFYFVLPTVALIVALVLLTPMGYWFVNEAPSHIGYSR
ncbi:MAG TPA: hypothetical protein VG317_17305 [Pseudonocardiaceae bacterium]|nr:hypothetical protein [Pseudonocardiaceae bacterium]